MQRKRLRKTDPVYGNAPATDAAQMSRNELADDFSRAQRKSSARLKEGRELADAIEREQALAWAASATGTIGHYAPMIETMLRQASRGGKALRSGVADRHDAIIKRAKSQSLSVERRNLVSATAAELNEPRSTVRKVLQAAGLIDPPKKRAAKAG
jgi:hypothetical protein